MSTHPKQIERILNHYPAIRKALVRFSLYGAWNGYRYLTLRVKKSDKSMTGVRFGSLESLKKIKEGCDTRTDANIFLMGNNDEWLLRFIHIDDKPCDLADHITHRGTVKNWDAYKVTGILVVVQNKHYRQDVIDCQKFTDFAAAGGELEATLYLPPKEGFSFDYPEKTDVARICRVGSSKKVSANASGSTGMKRMISL